MKLTLGQLRSVITEALSAPRCDIHNEKAVMRRNPRGGSFWACPAPDCEVTWNLDGTGPFGHPATVARASTRHSPVTSLRAKSIAKLQAQGLPAEEAQDWVDSLDLVDLQSLFNA